MNAEHIRIVPMRHCHLDWVVEIEKVSLPDAWDIGAFAHELSVEFALSYVGLQNSDRVAGYICTRICHRECSINKICTHPLFRRKGIGSLLLSHLVDETGKRCATHYYIEVASTNRPAICFYTRHGFRRIGCRSSYYAGGVDAVVMEMKKGFCGGKGAAGSV